MTRAELLERISNKEFQQWQIIYSNEPWGERRLDLLIAYLCAFIVNCFGRKEDDPPVELDNFLIPWWEGEKEDLEEIALKEKARKVFDSFKTLATKEEEDPLPRTVRVDA